MVLFSVERRGFIVKVRKFTEGENWYVSVRYRDLKLTRKVIKEMTVSLNMASLMMYDETTHEN